MVKAVLIRISTQAVIKEANYPHKDIVPITLYEDDGSVSTDLKWLIVNELSKPSFDPFTEKLTRLEEITTDPHPVYTELDQYRISFPVVALTAEEITDFQQGVDDSDASTQTNISHKDRGVQAFDRIYATIQRNFDTGNITGNQAKGLMENLYDALEPMYKGQWRLAKIRCDALTPPSNAKLLTIFNNIKSKINNYITNNF